MLRKGDIMNVHDALQKRKSVRAFLKKEVPQDVIERILQAAGMSPSGVNTQPWQVAVVTGQKKRTLEQKMEAAFRANEERKMDYSYYPDEWQEPYKTRRLECGLQMYSTLGIGREDKDKRLEQWAANYRSFDAPVALYFFMDGIMQTGSYIDYGMFLQSVMLAATGEGLATCPQAALGEYPKLVKKELGYPEDSILICGIALGYEDEQALVNSYRTPRLKVGEFTKFFS